MRAGFRLSVLLTVAMRLHPEHGSLPRDLRSSSGTMHQNFYEALSGPWLTMQPDEAILLNRRVAPGIRPLPNPHDHVLALQMPSMPEMCKEILHRRMGL